MTELEASVLSSISNNYGRITQHDLNMKQYYTAIIKQEFRSLQLDNELSAKSLFDLIDYCELLYEELKTNREPSEGIRSYIKGYLIFNYFINSFIIVHFKGFDAFIESNKEDFIIYLNVFAFYFNDETVRPDSSLTVTYFQLRRWMVDYLLEKNLLNFNVKDLHEWLVQYMEYLKDKDAYERNEISFSGDESSESSDDYVIKNVYDNDSGQNGTKKHMPRSQKSINITETLRALDVDSIIGDGDSVSDFMNRFPSIKRTPYLDENVHDKVINDAVNSSGEKVARGPLPYPAENSESVAQTSPYPASVPMLERLDSILPPKSTNIEQDQVPKSNGHHKKEYIRRDTHPHPSYFSKFNKKPLMAQLSQVSASGLIPYKHTTSPHSKLSTANSNFRKAQMRPPMTVPVPTQQIPHIPYKGYNRAPISTVPIEPPRHYHPAPSISNVCGLKNYGSSCYINLTIQSLFGIEPFRTLFQKLEYQKFIRDPKFVELLRALKSEKGESMLLSEAISGLLRVFDTHNRVSVAPTKFLRISSYLKPDFRIPNEQQDAQEFLLFVLERLHEELSCKVPANVDIMDSSIERYIEKWKIVIKDKDKEEYFKWYKSLIRSEGDSPIHDLFQGHLQNKLVCFRCKYESTSFSPFTILSLPIPSLNSDNVNLSDCLKFYIQDEVLAGENAWNCPECSKKEKGSPIPQSLDNHPVFTNKKSGLLKFSRKSKSPAKEGLKPMTVPKESSISIKTLDFVKLPQILFIHLSRFSMFNLTDKLNTRVQYPLELSFKTDHYSIRYKLVALINHYGNLKSGHYTALVNKSSAKEGEDNMDSLRFPMWCLFDDENIKMDQFHGNIALQGISSFHSRDVYVLCYERIT